MPLSERIVVDLEILAGKPVIRGTRLAVEFILELIAAGQSEAELLTSYPGLTRDHISCFSYAAIWHAYRPIRFLPEFDAGNAPICELSDSALRYRSQYTFFERWPSVRPRVVVTSPRIGIFQKYRWAIRAGVILVAFEHLQNEGWPRLHRLGCQQCGAVCRWLKSNGGPVADARLRNLQIWSAWERFLKISV